jgi:tetratricopeptide (TPR) repeat protein
LEALRKYAQADQANDRGDWERAVTLLEEALAEDSTFAMAWRKLGVLFQNEQRDPERAQASLTRAFELRDRLTQRERYLADAAYFTYVEEDRQRVIQAYETVLESYPQDRIALNNLAVTFTDMGEEERAASIYLRAIREGIAPAVSYTNAVKNLFNRGLTDSVSFVLERFAEAYPENPDIHRYSAAVASARFDYEEAEPHVRRFLETQVGNPGFEMNGYADLASITLLKGRARDAFNYIQRVFGVQEEIGADFIPQPKVVFEGMAWALIQSGFYQNHEEAVRILNEAWALRHDDGADPSTFDHLAIGRIYAMAGRPDRAREVIQDYLAEVDEEFRSTDGQEAGLALLQSLIDSAEGRAEEALEKALRARELWTDCDFCALTELGAAYADVGRHQEAVETYQGYLDKPVLFRLGNDNFGLHQVLIGMARSYEAIGDPEKAAEYYRWILRLWSDPDPELLPRIAELESALARVEG